MKVHQFITCGEGITNPKRSVWGVTLALRWPQDLKITEMRTSFWDVQAKCWDDLPIVQKILLPVVIACTVVNLDARTCVIYSFDDMTDDTRAHEYDHCKGGAHDDGWQEYFDKWKAKAGV